MVTPLTGHSDIDRAIVDLTTELINGIKKSSNVDEHDGAAIEKAIAELVNRILVHKSNSSKS